MNHLSEYIQESKIFRPVAERFFQLMIFIIRIFVKKEFEVDNVVVIALFKLGDTVFTIPAIRVLQKFYKKKITVVCFPESVPIYKEGLSDVHYHKLPHDYFFFSERIAKSIARREINALKPEIIFDFNGVLTSVSLILFCRSRVNVSMARQMFSPLYNYFLPMERKSHLIDRYYKIIALIVSINEKDFFREFDASTNNNGLILIHPFAGWKAKEWNLRKFINLASSLREYYDVSLIMNRDSVDEDIIFEIKKENLKIILTGSVEELVENIKMCKALIGNDSGPVHIADLLGKSTFCIYGPTNPLYPEPIGKRHSKYFSDIKCTPKADEELCFTFGGREGCPSFECMNSITTDVILSEVLEFLKKND